MVFNTNQPINQSFNISGYTAIEKLIVTDRVSFILPLIDICEGSAILTQETHRHHEILNVYVYTYINIINMDNREIATIYK
jgi:hypothetical protein